MSIDTSVDGDPGSCRRTARKLGDLHRQLAQALSYLDGQAHLPTAHFDGLAGDAYRTRCIAIGRTVDAAAESSGGLARGLDEYADGLAEVIAVMAGTRETARRELVLHGHTIPTPGGYATERQRAVYRTLAASVTDARRAEARLRDAWLSVITRHAVGPVEDLCLPVASGVPVAPAVVPGAMVSRLVAGAPRTSTTVSGAPRTSTSVEPTAVATPFAPPESVWVPWGGGDAG